MVKDALRPIVCDFGTNTVKAGFAGDDVPKAVFRCVVGARHVGDKAEDKHIIETLKLNRPVNGGIVSDCDWEDMVKIYRHTFYENLRISPEKHPILLTEPTLKHDANAQEKVAHRANREKMCHVMFETFNVPAMYVSPQPSLALISRGALSGFVLDSGVKNSQCVPIYEGQVVTKAIHGFDLAGRDLTNHLTQILHEKGYRFTTQADRIKVRNIKEKLCYVAIDYNKELKASMASTSSSINKYYVLPDRQVMTIGAERFKCPEAFFQPSMAGKYVDGIHKVVYNSINMCDEDIRKKLLGNIVVSGGSTRFPGFANRLEKEVSTLVEDKMSIIVAPLERLYSVWTGGSILASLSTFQQMWVTKSEYNEAGSSIVHDRCY